jgi:hypothetical protein
MLPQILATGLTVLLVEQDVSQALRVASHIQCLLEGHTTLEGRPSDVTPQQVEAAYFGLGAAAAAPASPPASGGPGGYGTPATSPTPTPAPGPLGPPGGYGGAGSPPVSGVGLGGVAPSEETEPSLWSGLMTSSRGS